VSISLSDCTWPSVPERYLLALKEAIAFVLAEFPEAVGIVASGTIVRGRPDPSSDLDIYVIQLAGFRQRIQAYFRGVPAEIFVNPPVAIERYFHDEERDSRPLTAHMLATGHLIAATDPITTVIVEKARAQLARQPTIPADLTQSRYMLATLLEDGVDVSGRDKLTSRMLLSLAVERLVRHAFVKAGRFQPRAKDLLKDLDSLDPEMARLARQFYRSITLRKQLRTANAIADRSIGARGFFEWKSGKEAVS
jgi:predicted nucleotidyltransferase